MVLVFSEQCFGADVGTVDMCGNNIQAEKMVFREDVTCRLGGNLAQEIVYFVLEELFHGRREDICLRIGIGDCFPSFSMFSIPEHGKHGAHVVPTVTRVYFT
jgi:hypothetical protein